VQLVIKFPREVAAAVLVCLIEDPSAVLAIRFVLLIICTDRAEVLLEWDHKRTLLAQLQGSSQRMVAW